jgi:hypothetical protein
LSATVSVPQATAPKVTAAVAAMAAAKAEYRRRRVVVSFMVFPLGDRALVVLVVTAAVATAQTDARTARWIRRARDRPVVGP